MPLIPWRPERDIERFFGDDFFAPFSALAERAPAMDVYETDKQVIAEVNLPGIDPDKVDINVQDQTLRVSGEDMQEEEEKDEDRGYFRKEIRRGSFQRAVHLPAPVKSGEADATYENGVLKIVMDKTEDDSSEKKIKIKRK